ARHQHAEAHLLGDAAQRRERGVRLEALPRPFAVHRLEVVEAPDAVEAELLGELCPLHHFRERHALLRDVETESHRVSFAVDVDLLRLARKGRLPTWPRRIPLPKFASGAWRCRRSKNG